ncbi:hypothetical protein KIPB_007282 [Kipferlia bialata]|uniref:Uncharacterized protein n=1 Tax=Kipferlia bialata TaxID=797122 RepID=A0A9K3GJV8_9EUKA|nr:hypothetical protein KIPB_007282 [Kipferlia bialata]|eukprot:g7282.t1
MRYRHIHLLVWLLVLICAVSTCGAIPTGVQGQCGADNPDFTDSSTLVCPQSESGLCGSYELSWLAPDSMEKDIPTSTTVTGLGIVTAGLVPFDFLEHIFFDTEYEYTDSWYNLVFSGSVAALLLFITDMCCAADWCCLSLRYVYSNHKEAQALKETRCCCCFRCSKAKPDTRGGDTAHPPTTVTNPLAVCSPVVSVQDPTKPAPSVTVVVAVSSAIAEREARIPAPTEDSPPFSQVRLGPGGSPLPAGTKVTTPNTRPAKTQPKNSNCCMRKCCIPCCIPCCGCYVGFFRDLFHAADLTTGKQIVNVSKIDSKIGLRNKRGTEGDLYLENETTDNMIGGCLSLLLLTICLFMCFWTIFAAFFKFNALLDLPKELYGPLNQDEPPCLRERHVETIPYSTLPSLVGKYLDTNIAANDNLYVIEAVSGSDWGVQCLPHSDILTNMSFEHKIRLVFSVGAGTIPFDQLPSLGVETSPVTVKELRHTGSLRIETDGCRLVGGPACSATFMDEDQESEYSPILSYGCYADEVGVYHHISAVSLSWATGYPTFSDMTFTVKMEPSDTYPEFGLNAGAVRTTVFPAAFNQYLITNGDDVIPFVKGHTMEIGYLAVRLGWWEQHMEYPRDALSEEDKEYVDTVIVPEIIEQFHRDPR